MVEKTREALLKRILDRLADALPEDLERAELRAALQANLGLALGTLEALEVLRALSTELPAMPDARALLACLRGSDCPVRGVGALRRDYERRVAAVHARVRAANDAPEMLDAYEALADSVLLGASEKKSHPMAAVLRAAAGETTVHAAQALSGAILDRLLDNGAFGPALYMVLAYINRVLFRAGALYVQVLLKRRIG